MLKRKKIIQINIPKQLKLNNICMIMGLINKKVSVSCVLTL